MTAKSRWTVSGLAASAALIVAVISPSGAASAARTGTTSAAPKAEPSVAATYPSTQGRFYHIAATSTNDVWAVGLTSGPGLIWHWNGSAWLEYPMSADVYLTGVAAISATDVWAVGGNNWNSQTDTIAYHWNGKTWTQVATPTPDGSAYFNAVAGSSADNVWAVGEISPGGPGESGVFTVPMIEHWNGKTWQQQTFNLPENSGEFNSVVAVGPDDVWAVGGTSNGGPSGALIEHWNGKTWGRVPDGAVQNRGYLEGIAATGPDNVWAVGFNNNTALSKSLIVHYNGKTWSPVPSPNPTGETDLWSVSALSATNAWTVGYTNPSQCFCGTVALHWNGKHWVQVATPDPPAQELDALLGVVSITPYDTWAVGTTDWSSTLIEHFNGKSWND